MAASLSKSLAGGGGGCNGNPTNEWARDRKREKKIIFLLIPLQEDAAIPFNGLNMQV